MLHIYMFSPLAGTCVGLGKVRKGILKSHCCTAASQRRLVCIGPSVSVRLSTGATCFANLLGLDPKTRGCKITTTVLTSITYHFDVNVAGRDNSPAWPKTSDTPATTIETIYEFLTITLNVEATAIGTGIVCLGSK